MTATVTSTGTDTLHVSYALFNNPTSEQGAKTFIVRTDAKPLAVAEPDRIGWTSSHGVIADSLGLIWTGLGTKADLAPNDSLAGFGFTAVGVPGIVRYHVQGEVLPPDFPDSLSHRVQAQKPVWQDSYSGWTVSVVALPVEVTAVALTTRLAELVYLACSEALNFIAEPAICTSSRARQRLAQQSAQANDIAGACSHLAGLVSEVNNLSDSAIRPEGRDLLRLRVEHFIRRHCR